MSEFGQWTGLVFGPLGTYILTTEQHHAWGWFALLLAALSWLSVGILSATPGLIIVQTMYALLSVRGMYTSWRT